MKRLTVILFALMFLFSMSITAFADNGGFVSSPSNNQAPTAEKVETESGVTVELEITPYANRVELTAEEKEETEQAYEEIKAVQHAGELNQDLVAVAQEMNIKSEDLAVQDLFHLDATVLSGTEEETGPFRVSLKCEGLENFVGLLHRENGVWVLVENAKVEGDILSFTVDSFSPFAIVVNNESAKTSDDSHILLYGAVAVVSLAALVVCWSKYRKNAA